MSVVHCPFHDCAKPYSSPSALKQHLLRVKAVKGNEGHPFPDEVWKKLEKDETLTMYTRPNDLPPEELKNCRKETKKRSCVKNKGTISQQKRANREHIKKRGESYLTAHLNYSRHAI